VLENLVRNALRHADTSVHIEVTRSAKWLHLVVQDDGPGFADEATKRDPDSAGLGLIIARRIIDAHGGTLDLQNGPEGGARVVVRLPLT
jgi:two-component system osmolarity sensor histidine kinase EnvZ